MRSFDSAGSSAHESFLLDVDDPDTDALIEGVYDGASSSVPRGPQAWKMRPTSGLSPPARKVEFKGDWHVVTSMSRTGGHPTVEGAHLD